MLYKIIQLIIISIFIYSQENNTNEKKDFYINNL